MKILFADQFSEPGGAQISLMHTIEAAMDRGWTSCLAAPGEGELVQWALRRNIRVISLPPMNLTHGNKKWRDLVQYAQVFAATRDTLRRASRSEAVDLIYVNGPRLLPAISGMERPVLFHSHNYVGGLAPRLLTSWSAARTKATVIAASGFTAAQFLGLKTPVRVVYNGSPDYNVRERQFNRPALRIGMLGRIAPQKGQLDFARAAQILVDAPAGFAIYGDVLFIDSAYGDRVRKAAGGAPVRFEGWRSDIHKVFEEIDILAVPSSSGEASPRVIVEAFSAGVPVVAYPSGGIPELIDDGRTGLLTKSASAEGLAESLQSLLQNRTRMREIALAARTEWERRFTIPLYRQAVCDAISRACDRDSHSSHPSRLRPSSRERLRTSSR